MSFSSDLIQFLNTQSAVTAIIGAVPTMRFYPVTKPQGVIYPCVIYQRVNTSRVYSHGGDSNLHYPRFQYTVEAKTALAADNLARALVASLSGFKGMMGTTRVDSFMFVNDIDDYDPTVQIYKRILDAVVWFSEG